MNTTPGAPRIRASRVLLKALLLFIALNVLMSALNPLPALGGVSIYNTLVPGRQRLPYGDNPERAYNVSVLNVDAMFATHEINAGSKPADEFRVILIGDSSTWGWLLTPQESLAAQINRMQLKTDDGRAVRAYNLGYPIMSLAKDVLIIDRAMQYQPDAVVWLLTLESFPASKQLFHPLLQRNPQLARQLIAKYDLALNPNDPQFVEPAWHERNFIGQRREVADWLRLQLYGVMWAATGIDQDYPAYERAATDLAADERFGDLQPPMLREDDLALDQLRGGARAVGDVPLLMVNEPMLISSGQNSDVRYNFFYPRWAYDQYRQIMLAQTAQNRWIYLDLWDALPASEFTNSAVHYTPAGAQSLAARLAEPLLQLGRINTP
jgi:hypothetical protein